MLLAVAPVITLLQYIVGELRVEWNPQTYTDFVVTLEDKNGSIHINQPVTGTSITFAQTLNPNDVYTVTVTAWENGLPGPSSAVRNPIIVAPVYAALIYSLTGGNGYLAMNWGAIAGADAYLTTVDATNGSFITNLPSTTPSCGLAKNLAASLTYEVTTVGMSADGVVIGPPNDTLTAIVGQPGFSLLQYSLAGANGSISTQWSAVDHADQYALNIMATDGSFDKTYPSSVPQLDAAQTLDSAKTYEFTVAGIAQNGVVQGPSSEALTPLLTSPVPSGIKYSLQSGSGALQVDWIPVTNAASYITSITATDGSLQKNLPSIQSTVTLAQTLDPSKSYLVSIIALADGAIIVGPASTDLQALVAAPAVSLVSYDLPGGTGSLATEWAVLTDADGYITTVAATDNSYEKNIPTAATNSTLSKTLDTSKTYTVVVQGTANGGVVIGPESGAVTVLSSAPAGSKITYDGTQLTGNWQADNQPQCTGYIAALLQDDTVVQQTPATGTTAVFPGPLAQGSRYTMQVRSTGANVQGPWSDEAMAPFATQVIYQYDQLGRLQTATMDAAFSYSYTYSDTGNILTAVSAPTP